MKQASKVMYIIARIYNIIEIAVFALLLILLGLVPAIGSSALATPEEQETALIAGITMTVVFAILLLIAVVVCILLNKAYKSLETSEKKNHIVMIVLGVISENPFLFLGGLFGVIAA